MSITNKKAENEKEEGRDVGKKLNEKFFRTVARGDEKVVARLQKLYWALQHLQLPEEVTLSLPPKWGLRNIFMGAAQGKKLTIISTGCPDYSTTNGYYDFRSLGEGVSILPRLHLAVARVLLPVLAEHNVEFEYYILVADLAEGTDEVVVAKFCDGSIEEFLRRCQCTVEGIADLIKKHFPPGLAAKMHAQTFSEFYGDRYTRTQNQFREMLLQKLEEDDSFRQNFMVVHAGRIPLYQQFLRGYNDDPSQEVLIYRTANGIAQYLTHFALVRLEQEAPVMINHRTINLRWVNQTDLVRSRRERKKLEQRPRVPIFVIENKIY